MNIYSGSWNLFSCLVKGNPQKENFFSEAFTFVVRKLLISENKGSKEFAKELLGKICDVDFLSEESIFITREETVKDGRIDIKIETHAGIFYLENKIDANLGYRQLERYRIDLDKQKKNIKKVILITKYKMDRESSKFADMIWMWYQIYDVMLALKEKYMRDVSPSEINIFLVDHLLAYIKEERMTFEKVNSSLIDGISSMLNLLDQIRYVLDEKRCPIVSRSAGEKFNGYYFKASKDSDIQDWIGIFYYDRYGKPTYDQIVFELKDLEVQGDIKGYEEYHLEFDKKKFNDPSLILSFEKSKYFVRNREKQLDVLRDFIQKGIDIVGQHRIKKE